MGKNEKAYVLGFFSKKECVINFVVELCLHVIIMLQAPLISNFINNAILKKDETVFSKYIAYFVLWGGLFVLFSMGSRIIENDFKNKHRSFLVNKLILKMINVQNVYAKNTNDELKALFEIDLPVVLSSGFLILKSMFINFIFVMICIISLGKISWILTIVILIILLISYIGEFYLSSKLNKINYELRAEDVKIQGFFSEGIEKWEEIRDHNMEEYYQNRYYHVIDKYISFMNKWVLFWENRNLYMDMKKMILQYALIYAVGGIFVGQKIITAPLLILYGQIFVTMFGFVDGIINSFNNIFDARPNWEKLCLFLQADECKKNGKLKEGDIKISNVSFGYERKENIFHNFSCKIEEKKINVIAGDNGTGKSTLCKIIMGLLEIDEGKIYINGEKIDKDSSLIDSGYFSLYSSSCGFFHATLREIIDAKVTNNYENDLNYFLLNQRIDKLEDGINTKMIDEKIVSGGEKQRLFLIRTLLSNAPILIFDEPTSALDRHNIELFADKLRELRGQKTVILITHEPSLKILADNIVDLNMK